MLARVVGLISVLWIGTALGAGAIVIEGSDSRARLLELYTSEGCSSCPPADRWLSTLERDDRLWRDIVPLAFHVDYWDYIGWPDRFASTVYSERQRTHARQGNLRTVYTPGLVLGGEEWRAWFHDRRLPERTDQRVGALALRIEDDAVAASFTPVREWDTRLELHLALLGFDLSTQVRAGENQGRRLDHDFVVIGYETVPLGRDGAAYSAITPLPRTDVESPRRALAVWVSQPGQTTPIQATGGWLDGR